jgi:spartin
MTESESTAAGYIKLTLPPTISTESRETFESILWWETSFSTETVTPLSPTAAQSSSAQSPPSYADPNLRSRLVLLNDQGDVVGTLADNEKITEHASLSVENQGQHEKEPVLIEQGAGHGGAVAFTATPVSQLSWTPTANPNNSNLIAGADYLSKGIIVGSGWLSRQMESGAATWVKSRPPTDSPMQFNPTTKSRLATANKYTGKAVVVTGKTAAVIGGVASAVGAKIAQATGGDSPSKGSGGWRGMVNKSLVAFNTVSDSLEAG